MRISLLLLLFVPAFGQFQLSVTTGAAEKQVEAVHDLGMTEVGDPLVARFRLRNTGAAAATADGVAVAGAQFSPVLTTPLPAFVEPGGFVDFAVRFDAASHGSFSASLTTPAGAVILRASAAPAALVFLDESGIRRQVQSGELVAFPQVESGQTSEVRFLLQNPGGLKLPFPAVAISGAGFSFAESPLGITELGPGESFYVRVAFSPGASGRFEGLLQVGGKRFPLQGDALKPPAPAPEILLDTPVLRSGLQSHVTVRLAYPAREPVDGQLSMRLRGGNTDPAMLFAGSGTQSAAFSVRPGDEELRFAFQTGTTAGEIVFALQFGTHQREIAASVPAEPVTISTAGGARIADGLELRITAFDNTHATQEVAFTFFDAQGRAIAPGTQRVQASEVFASYYQGSKTGGAFTLEARVPIAGNATQVHFAQVEFTNPAGAAATQRIVF
jgi:hypothetical protein